MSNCELNAVREPPALPPKQKHLRGLSSREDFHTKRSIELNQSSQDNCPVQSIQNVHRLLSKQENIKQHPGEVLQKQNPYSHLARSANIRSLVDEPLFSIEEEASVLEESSQNSSENELNDVNKPACTDISIPKNRTVRYSDGIRRIQKNESRSPQRVSPNHEWISKNGVSSTKYQVDLDKLHTLGKLELPLEPDNMEDHSCKTSTTSARSPTQIERALEENVSPYGMVDLSNLNKEENFNRVINTGKVKSENNDVVITDDTDLNYDNVENSRGERKMINWMLQKYAGPSRENPDGPVVPKSTDASHRKNSSVSTKIRSKCTKHSTAVSSLDRHGTSVSSSKSPIHENADRYIYEEVNSPLAGNASRNGILDSQGKNARIQEILNMIDSPDISGLASSSVSEQFPVQPEYRDQAYPEYDNFKNIRCNDGGWRKYAKDAIRKSGKELERNEDIVRFSDNTSASDLIRSKTGSASSSEELEIGERVSPLNRSRGRKKSSFTLQRFRSKSQDRITDISNDEDNTAKTNDIHIPATVRIKAKSESRLSRRISKKSSERRARSSERNPRDNKTTGKSPGRNPVNFIRKLLKKDRDASNENIVADCKGPQMPESTRINAEIQQESWTLPRNLRSSKTNSSSKKTRMRSPPSHRARKMLHSKLYPDSDSSSDEKKRYVSPKENEEESFLVQPLPESSIDNSTTKTNSNSSLLRCEGYSRSVDSESASNQTSDYDTSSGIVSEVDGVSPKILLETKSLSGRMKPRRNGINIRSSRSDPDIFSRDRPKENTQKEKIGNSMGKSIEREEIIRSDHHAKRHGPKTNKISTPATYLAFVNQQRMKYRTLVSLNAQTLTKITQKWLSDWRNKLPVGGFLITSWSDILLTSRTPKCVIENSPVYYAQFASNKEHEIACQLLLKECITSRQFRQLENCSTLTMHPNMCIVCSFFQCKIPGNLFKGQVRSKNVDALCVVLTSRPEMTLLNYLDSVMTRQLDDIYKEFLLILIQVMHALQDLVSSGFHIPCIKAEHVILTEDRGLVQILPHMEWDSERNCGQHASGSYSTEILNLMKVMINKEVMKRAQSKSKTRVNPREQKSIFLVALQEIMQHLEHASTQSDLFALTQLIQCALWGPLSLECIEAEEMLPYDALSLWIDMEQAKLVNGLAVLLSNKNDMSVSLFLKYQYFSQITAESLISSLKILKRV